MSDEKQKRTKKSMIGRDTAKATSMLPTKETIADGVLLANRYRVVEKIGAGAMGMVYKVSDQTMDDQIFAIKVLPPEAANDEGAVERLKKEAQAAINLNHPNIMGVNYFEGQGETKFIVMEYLEGPNLDVALARKERFSEDEVIDLAKELCPALDYAHDRKIIHRDIKPANLIYTTEGGKEVVKIADFGIAYRLRETMTKLTGQNSTGTLLYVPPEQLAGMPTDARSDQYSLAVTFYELLTGDPPFRGPTEAITEQINNAKAQPIDGISNHVNKAISRAMAKDPNARFDNCADFLAALENQSEAKPPKKAVVASEGQSKSKAGYLFFFLLLALLATVAYEKSKINFEPYGRELNELLMQKEYEKVGEVFSKELGEKLSLEKMSSDWERISGMGGFIQRIDEVTVSDSKREGCKLVSVIQSCTRGTLTTEFTVDGKKELWGIMFRFRYKGAHALALKIAKLLEEQKWEELRKTFTKGLDAKLSTKRLSADWLKHRKRMGRYLKSELEKRFYAMEIKTPSPPDIKSTYSNGHIVIRCGVNESTLLNSLQFRSVVPKKSATNSEEPLQDKVKERTLYFAGFFPGKTFKDLLDESPELKRTLSEEKLRSDWKKVAGEPGRLRGSSNFRHLRQNGEDIALLINAFENCRIEFKFQFDKDINGLKKLYFRKLPKESGGQ